MIALLLALPDAQSTAKSFLAAANASTSGCTVHVEVDRELPNSRVNFSGASDQQYLVTLDRKGRVIGAQNYGLTYRRAKNLDKAVKPLTKEAARKKLLDWVKRYPVPEGYAETSFTYRDQWGNTSISFDRKVAGYWINAPFAYSIDTRTGVFNTFGARYAGSIRSTLTAAKVDAIRTAEGQIGDLVTKYGKHSSKAEIMYIRPDANQDDLVLGYAVWFSPAVKSDKTRFYNGARVFIDGASGRPIGRRDVFEIK